MLVDLTHLDPHAFRVASIPKFGGIPPVAWYTCRHDLKGERLAPQPPASEAGRPDAQVGGQPLPMLLLLKQDYPIPSELPYSPKVAKQPLIKFR